MCHAILRDPKFHDFLLRIDEDEAQRVGAAGCRCGERLHSARYPRKPRGAPRSVLGEQVRRASFCCAGCRRRCTPRSVRFLGRRVYLGAVVVLATALAQGFSGRRLTELGAMLAVPARTLLRWRQWWLGEFVATPLWRAARGWFVPPPPAPERMPASLLERFDGDERQRLMATLRLVAPLSTLSEAG